jgi:hypothetical protein
MQLLAALHTITFVTMTEATVYHQLQDLRLLARRDSSLRSIQMDQELELFRLCFLEAFEQWMDGMEEMNLTPFIVTADKIISSNKDLLKWLKKELDRDMDR